MAIMLLCIFINRYAKMYYKLSKTCYCFENIILYEWSSIIYQKLDRLDTMDRISSS